MNDAVHMTIEPAYLESTIRLAELEGWTHLEVRSDEGIVVGAPTAESDHLVIVPNWIHDDNAAEDLRIKYRISADFDGEDGVHASWEGSDYWQQHAISKHQDNQTARRFAIVQAAIAKLSEK